MDLAITAYLLFFGAAILFRLGKRYGHQHPISGRILLGGGIAIAVWLAWSSGGSLRWAQLVPHSFVLLVANASVILVVGSAGLIVGTHCLTHGRQCVATAALCLTATWFIGGVLVRPLWQPLELTSPTRWQDGVCLQSQESTCAPAAAATLLRLHGIHRTEKEMAAACLTSCNGTLALGTFRGLCIGTRGAAWAPRVLIDSPLTYPSADLISRLPMLAHIHFGPGATPFRMGAIDHHDGHTVVILEQLRDGTWLIADPAVGTVRWSDRYLRQAWIGEGIYLVSNENHWGS